MQVSIKWLKDYIDFDLTAEDLADKLTMAGVPVERVIRMDEGLEKVIAGKIESVEKHPDSDHLNICKLNIGKEELLQIVTGAQNVKVGQMVPVATVGAHLPNGQKISKGKLRGVESLGMMCSAGELKLDTSKMTEEELNGIYILKDDVEIGTPVAKVLGLDDVILEFELTANRADCFSVFGIVREISVLTGNKPHFPEIKCKEEGDESASALVKISVDAVDLCSRFSARVLRDVKIAPSPHWMQERLAGAGIRSINNVVDVTNFVMVELGQPMHAYDYDHVAGHSLTARRSVEGENLHTLDDSSRLAKGGELVIADAEKAAGLAGVMGGFESEVTENTTSIILEAAAFNGASIRRTARSCGLHTEASGRFERGVDVTATCKALDRAAQLLEDMGACKTAKGIVDAYPMEKDEREVAFKVEEINARLGTDIPGEKMKEILANLGFSVIEYGEYYIATVPTWRNDVSRMEDISEEIARIYGFENIPSTMPKGEVIRGVESERGEFMGEVRNILSRLGMTETLSFSFTHPELLKKIRVPEDSELMNAIKIMNPLTEEYPLVRTTLLTNIMETAARNFSRKNEDFAIFEIAPVFFPKKQPVTELPTENQMIAGLFTGKRNEVSWSEKQVNYDFYDVKGVVENALNLLGITNYTVEKADHFMLHPGKSAVFKKGREIIATFGEIHPSVAEAFGAKNPTFVFEMSVDVLMKYRKNNYKFEPIPKYPAITRDLAMLVKDTVSAGEVLTVIEKCGGKYFKGATLFDVYAGKQIETGKKSLAFTMTFRSPDKTLTDEEADAAFNDILNGVKTKFNAELRG
ncbi:MAG: phenylalanine--tRNA ligase subunit beta [Selenomonadaceae bacterium]|nr:phenylalanine--tRNA ligase subunit beta [Selenomonadaceae bacterium]